MQHTGLLVPQSGVDSTSQQPLSQNGPLGLTALHGYKPVIPSGHVHCPSGQHAGLPIRHRKSSVGSQQGFSHILPVGLALGSITSVGLVGLVGMGRGKHCQLPLESQMCPNSHNSVTIGPPGSNSGLQQVSPQIVPWGSFTGPQGYKSVSPLGQAQFPSGQQAAVPMKQKGIKSLSQQGAQGFPAGYDTSNPPQR